MSPLLNKRAVQKAMTYCLDEALADKMGFTVSWKLSSNDMHVDE